MGTSAPIFRDGGKQEYLSMKQFCVVLCLFPLALGEADPQVYGKPLAVAVTPRCVTQYQTVSQQQCSTVPEQQCSTETVQTSKTVTEQQCSTEQKQSCSTEYKQVPEQRCSTVSTPVQSQSCSTQTKYVPQTTYSTVCDQVATSVAAGASLGIGSASGLVASSGLSQLVRGKREADPQLLAQTPLCRQVAQTTQKAVSSPVCRTVMKSVPQQKCTTTPVTSCVDVTKEIPSTSQAQKCATVQKPVCETVSQQVPSTVCSNQAVAVARGSPLGGGPAAGASGALALSGGAQAVAQPVSPFANKLQG